MTIERTVEIPANHRLYFDIPSQIPAGRAKITVNIDAYTQTTDIEAFDNEAEATEFATRLSRKVIHETR